MIDARPPVRTGSIPVRAPDVLFRVLDHAPLRRPAGSLTIAPMMPAGKTSRKGPHLPQYDRRPRPPEPLVRAAARAITAFDMIRPGDRVLLALSGGKDSLSLLHVLLALQERIRIPFSLAAATVDPGIDSYDPSFLKDYAESIGVRLFYVRQEIVERAKQTMRGDSFCSYCARMRRGTLYRTAREHGFNVLALGQHLDDIAEAFLMSAFREGRLRTMRAHYRNDAGDIRVIRPFVDVRERQLADFAERAMLPAIRDNCPSCFRAPGERQYVKGLLAAEERRVPGLFASLRQALQPLLAGDADARGTIAHRS
ncbi:MAG: tRNA 2-thiocytidine biosynthesis TtcA family protein [Acidiferrobacteraceae bacterium]